MVRICLFGPVQPIRGGISHYTTQLYHSLKSAHDVTLISYKRQYPSILYPGSSQYSEDGSVEGPPAEWLFDCMSPLSWRRIVARVRELQPDCFIYNWVTWFHALPLGLITRGLRSLKSTRVLAICHNAKQHESLPLERHITRFALRAADALLVHSAKDEEALRDIGLTNPITRAFLPSLGHLSESSISRDEARARLGTSGQPVLLFFGYVRAYKGLMHLIEAMPEILTTLPNARLLIVGEFWDDEKPYLSRINQLDIGDAVTVVDEYVPDEDVPLYFAASDICVLPYVTATQSAIVQLAYGAGKPVITTSVGGLPDVVSDGVSGLLVPPADPEALAEAVGRAFAGDTLDRLTAGARQQAELFSWESLVSTIEELACAASPSEAHADIDTTTLTVGEQTLSERDTQ